MSTREKRASCLGERLLDRSKSRLILASVAVASLLVARVCGSSTRATPKQTPRPTPSPAPSVSATPEGTDAAIIAAYRAEIAAYDQALADTNNPGAWTLPALADTMVNPELDAVKAELQSDEDQGIVVTGMQTPLNPQVVSVTDTSATVSDCVWDTTVQYYRAHDGFTPEPVPDQPAGTQPGGDATTATLMLVSGKWMVADVAQEVDSCSGS
jgi:hypothetical protein